MIYFVHGDALSLRASLFSVTRVFVNYNVITYVLDGRGYNHFFGLVSNETFEIHLTRRPRLFIVSHWNWNFFFRFSSRRVNFIKPKSDFILWNFKFATTLKILLCGTRFNIKISIWERHVRLFGSTRHGLLKIVGKASKIQSHQRRQDEWNAFDVLFG